MPKEKGHPILFFGQVHQTQTLHQPKKNISGFPKRRVGTQLKVIYQSTRSLRKLSDKQIKCTFLNQELNKMQTLPQECLCENGVRIYCSPILREDGKQGILLSTARQTLVDVPFSLRITSRFNSPDGLDGGGHSRSLQATRSEPYLDPRERADLSE